MRKRSDGVISCFVCLGLSDDVRRGALRLSLGHTSSSADIDRAISVITNSIGQLRERKAARKQRA